jgi:hypothetical protein
LLKNYASTYSSKPAQRQYLLADKKIINSITSKPTRIYKRLPLCAERAIPNTRVLEKRATPVIPQEYKEFQKLFKEELELAALPKH